MLDPFSIDIIYRNSFPTLDIHSSTEYIRIESTMCTRAEDDLFGAEGAGALIVDYRFDIPIQSCPKLKISISVHF